ncbi:MAG: DUF58 domain-containing protein [Betaproteobacteria bacterium]|nr:DUF58 domain-containing protein [Betaproteobacteria bacterium]
MTRVRALALPSGTLTWALCAATVLALTARLLGESPAAIWTWTLRALVLLALLLIIDLLLTRRRWRAAPITIDRVMPAALALDVTRPVRLHVHNPGQHRWRVQVFDGIDPSLDFDSLPLTLMLPPASSVDSRYHVTPRRRGEIQFMPASLRLRSILGLLVLQRAAGTSQSLRVFPNFSQVARYAWLAGDRRLSEVGFKAFRQRGEGTDFKQLAEYRVGDPIRHIDWKATLKHNKPIVREFQDERDQCVLFLLDCGRRMRAQEDGDHGATEDISHFDQALNALMLLSYVALRAGDAVGAMTFGTAAQSEKLFASRKGVATFNALMASSHALQPEPEHADYMMAARTLMRRHAKRSLVVILTNFRDEDASELGPRWHCRAAAISSC